MSGQHSADAAAREAGLLVSREAHVLRLELNRPEAGNSLTRPLMSALEEALRTAGDDASLRVVLLTGAGERIFCAGADLKADKAFKLEDTEPSAPFARVLRALRNIELPVVARVNGSASGGGVGLLGVCDFVIAADHARFAVSEINVGLFPTQGVTALQRSLPHARLVRMCMTGEPIDAREAAACGLAGEVAARGELDAAIDRTLQTLLSKSPSALRRGKYMLRAIESMGFEESLCLTETMLRVQSTDPNVAEGLAAFRERRAPQWK